MKKMWRDKSTAQGENRSIGYIRAEKEIHYCLLAETQGKDYGLRTRTHKREAYTSRRQSIYVFRSSTDCNKHYNIA